MSRYFEKLPAEVNPIELPLRKMAPCWADGIVITEDYDTKEARCQCRYYFCYVNRNNIITGKQRLFSPSEKHY